MRDTGVEQHDKTATLGRAEPSKIIVFLKEMHIFEKSSVALLVEISGRFRILFWTFFDPKMLQNEVRDPSGEKSQLFCARKPFFCGKVQKLFFIWRKL